MQKNLFSMKKSFFSLAFLSLIFFASSKITYSQSLSTFFHINISDKDVNPKDAIEIEAIKESEDKGSFKKPNESELLKSKESVAQPISSKISIGLGKALFEKYIK